MTILHTITCSRFVPHYNANEEFQRSIIRDRVLTLSGCERILRRAENEDGRATHQLVAVRLQTAVFQK